MRTTAAGPQGAYNAGQVYEVPTELAQAFLRAGAAELFTPEKPVEMAVSASQLTAEKALSPRGKAKK
jgi:hypothetical protein